MDAVTVAGLIAIGVLSAAAVSFPLIVRGLHALDAWRGRRFNGGTR